VSAAASTLEERVAEVRGRIARAASRSGRLPESVTLIAVTKTHPAETVLEAFTAGLTDFGENRVQEATAKAEEVSRSLGTQALVAGGPRWHLIGHLQTNKVRAAIGTFAILHSVDSERLLRAVSGAATSPIQVFIEVNIAAEPQKYGVTAAEVPALVATARALPNIEVLGLMTVAPHVADMEETRPVFRALKTLARRQGLSGLSMGMTNDFEVAIEEGATHVRVGRALFGERP